jgi:hypothetical protein
MGPESVPASAVSSMQLRADVGRVAVELASAEEALRAEWPERAEGVAALRAALLESLAAI